MIHDRLQVSAVGHLKEKEKKEIIFTVMFRFQHVFFFLLQIVPLERNKTRLKLNQTLAKQKKVKTKQKNIY